MSSNLTIPASTVAADFSKIGIGIIPFTPVPFSGENMLIAIGRLAGYSALAYFTFAKHRKLSYTFMGAAAVSLSTSLLDPLWKKHTTGVK